MSKETFTELTRGSAALSSRPGGSRLLLGHSLVLVLVPHAVSHPLHPSSPWKPLLQAQTQLSITASSATVTDEGSHTRRHTEHLCMISHSEELHLQGVPDGQQSMLGVLPLSLAGGAQVVVWTHRTLEASSHNGSLAAVTGDVRVQCWGWTHVRRRGIGSSRWRRVSKGKGREGMKRKVSAVLLLF